MKKPRCDKQVGTIEFTMGFYSKVVPGMSESNVEVPQQILETEAYKKARKATLTNLEAAVAVTPPPEEFLSGILGIQVPSLLKKSRDTVLTHKLASRDPGTWGQAAQHE